jgi:hypothetical protein
LARASKPGDLLVSLDMMNGLSYGSAIQLHTDGRVNWF